jgi:hypothetical protein
VVSPTATKADPLVAISQVSIKKGWTLAGVQEMTSFEYMSVFAPVPPATHRVPEYTSFRPDVIKGEAIPVHVDPS